MISTVLLYVILGVIVLTTIAVVALILIERNKNYCGDSSLIPGCLMWAGFILVILILWGGWTGRIILQ